MYEDPGQREEKNRLMSLFESQSLDGADGKMSRRERLRRSVRMAGF